MSMQKLTLIGHVGGDPDTRDIGGGNYVTNVSLAVSEKWKDKQSGEQKEKTTWFRLAFWGRLGEVASDYIRKGSLIYVEGTVSARAYEDKQQKLQASLDVTVRELKLLSSKNGNAGNQEANAPERSVPPTTASAPAATAPAAAGADFDDDIPF